MTDTTVKYFASTMTGTATMDNTAGTLITILDACLVNGFGEVTLDSLAVSSNVATATDASGHGFTMVGATGPVITIAGATPSGLNGQWRVTVTSTTEFTFTTAGIGDQTATGTITAKRSPAGFSKTYSGTNKAVYRSDDVTGNRFYLRVDDSVGASARARGYETMSDVDTGTGLFPTETQLSGGGYVYKANGTARPWVLIADGKIFHFFCDSAGNNSWSGGLTFGDIVAFKAVDPYATVLICSTTSSSQTSFTTFAAGTGSWIARAHTGAGTATTAIRYGHGSSGYLGYAGSRAGYPNPVDLRLHAVPVDCWDSLANGRRGLMPGVYDALHNTQSYYTNLMTFEGAVGLANRTCIIVFINSYVGLFDVTGPWR